MRFRKPSLPSVLEASIRSLIALLVLVSCRHAQTLTQDERSAASGDFTFTYTPPPGAPDIASISVAGSFNYWSTAATPMRQRADGVWEAAVALEEGEHEYKFFINGAWPPDMCGDRTWGHPQRDYWIDPDAERCEADGNQGRNAVVSIAPAAALAGIGFQHHPQGAAYLSAAGGRLSVRFHVNQRQVDSAHVRAGGRTVAMHHQLSYGSRAVWRASLPSGTMTYSVVLHTAGGEQEHGPYTVPAEVFRAVPWVGDAIGYQIFPERFANGDPGNDHHALASDAWHFMHERHRGQPPVLTRRWDGDVTDAHCCHQYFGGDLQGIIDRLDHLQSLGATLIYLNPIFSAGSAHGYDTFDYLDVAPNLGDAQTLRALLDSAAARGMRVMWDFVPNHVGVGHRAFQEAVRSGHASPYWPWFRFNVPAAEIEVGNGAHYESWSGYGSLPKLDTRHADVMAHLLDVTRRWTRFGFHGIRVDVPNEIVNRKEFFRAFREAAKGIDPDVYLVGEIWQRSPGWLQGDEFDALMNYAIGQRVVERFATSAIPATTAADEMARLYAEYPEASVAMQFNLISSHDTGRLLTKMGGGGLGDSPSPDALMRHRLASAMLYGLPGMPVTFQGDECAFLGAGGGREENRYPMQWERCDAAMLAHYRQLATLRRELAALRSPVIRSHESSGSLLAFLRGEPGRGEVLALFNSAPTPASLPLPAGSWTNAATGTLMPATATISAYGWRYLLRQ